MKVDSIKSCNNHQAFGTLKLGQGGANRILSSVPMPEARRIVSNNFFNKCDILVTSKAVEVIPPEKTSILKVSDKIASGSDFTDIEVFEHDVRMIFKLDREIPDSELNKYGHDNRQVSLAEAVSEVINRCLDWKKNIRIADVNDSIAIYSHKINGQASELERFCENYGMFG